MIPYICLTDAPRVDILNRRDVRGLEITNEIAVLYWARYNIWKAKGKYEKAEYCPTELRSLYIPYGPLRGELLPSYIAIKNLFVFLHVEVFCFYKFMNSTSIIKLEQYLFSILVFLIFFF